MGVWLTWRCAQLSRAHRHRLHQTGIPEEYEPGLNVRFMGIDTTAIMNYLVTAYYSMAILVPDAAGILENVQVGWVPE